MRRDVLTILVAVMQLALLGCGTSASEIAKLQQPERADIFTEVSSDPAPPPGYADVIVRATLKTPLEGHYLFESGSSLRGRPGYPFIVNIDGQPAVWKVDGRKDSMPKYENGHASRNPEAGDGMKYVLQKKVRLAAGKHKVSLGLPEEGYLVTTEIQVASTGQYTLEYRPEYRYKVSPTRVPTFLRGIDRYDVALSDAVPK